MHGPMMIVMQSQSNALQAAYHFGWRSDEDGMKDFNSLPCQAWHCSNCLTQKQLKNKLVSFSHAKQIGAAYFDQYYLQDIFEICSFGRQLLDRSWSNLPGNTFMLSSKLPEIQALLPI